MSVASQRRGVVHQYISFCGDRYGQCGTMTNVLECGLAYLSDAGPAAATGIVSAAILNDSILAGHRVGLSYAPGALEIRGALVAVFVSDANCGFFGVGSKEL